MNGLRFDPGAVRSAAATLAHRAAVAVSFIVMAVGVALAGTMLPSAVGQLASRAVPFAPLERLVVVGAMAAPGAWEEQLAAVAANEDSAVSEEVTQTVGAAVNRSTGGDGH